MLSPGCGEDVVRTYVDHQFLRIVIRIRETQLLPGPVLAYHLHMLTASGIRAGSQQASELSANQSGLSYVIGCRDAAREPAPGR